MATGVPFSGSITMKDVVPPARSVGAHLAAKLQCFASDERTLTDELCDMLSIWLTKPQRVDPSLPRFGIELRKTTAPIEVQTGADLELVVSSPLGKKRCLLQAKVLDPTTGKLRCDSTRGWEDLRVQLSKARMSAGNLAFLLVYVPGALLNGALYGYPTYEQNFLSSAKGRLSACRGATVISVDDLLDSSDQWLDSTDKVKQIGRGQLRNGIPFWRFLLELMLCRRSSWHHDAPATASDGPPAFRTLSVGARGVSAQMWREIEGMSQDLLRASDDEG